MKIAVNTRLLLKNKLEGIGWFSYETLRRITAAQPEHEFIFIFDRPYSEEFIFNSNIKPIVVQPPARHPFLYYLWFEHSIPYILHRQKADLFLSPDGFLSLSSKVPQIAVMHDINFVHRPQDLPFLTAQYYNYYFPRFAQKAARLATVSDFSKHDICQTYNINPNKVDVTYNGVNTIYSPISAQEINFERMQLTQGKPYFVFVGSLHPRKNVVSMLKAFEEFRKIASEDIKMVIVGEAMFKTKEIKEQLAAMSFQKEVIFTGRLLPEKLKNVLASALALTFVPYFEGFGIPIIEAMNCDIPVITSNVTSMPEVSGDAALLVNPCSVEEIKNAMFRIATNGELRAELIEKGRIQRQRFSWQQTADKLWNCVSHVIENSCQTF